MIALFCKNLLGYPSREWIFMRFFFKLYVWWLSHRERIKFQFSSWTICANAIHSINRRFATELMQFAILPRLIFHLALCKVQIVGSASIIAVKHFMQTEREKVGGEILKVLWVLDRGSTDWNGGVMVGRYLYETRIFPFCNSVCVKCTYSFLIFRLAELYYT